MIFFDNEMPTPRDPDLYRRAKASVYRKIKRHSAYRSGLVVQKYKKRFAEKYGKSKRPYTGKRKTGKLRRWFRERWTNQRGETGYSRPGDVYRPTRRISSKTPATFAELKRSELRKAMHEKLRKGRVKRFKR